MAELITEKYPKGFKILFFTEMWERFSFYGMRSLLVLFMTQQFGFDDSRAYGLYGAYVSLVYTTPVIGGIIADRILGFKRAIVFGGFLIMLGHICLAIPGHFFYYGLAFIICGTGFLKPSISSTVGELYAHNDAGRDSGFTLFYMGINIGALVASILVGIVVSRWGWHAGFGLAAIGMMIALLTFIVGIDSLAAVGQSPNLALLQKRFFKIVTLERVIYLLAFLLVPVLSWTVQQVALVGFILAFITLGSFFFVIHLAWNSNKTQRYRLLALLLLCVFSISFFALFEQAGSSMTLFTERTVDRSFLGWEVPTPVFQLFNPLFIILLAPILSVLWLKLAARSKEPSTPSKFFLGLLFVALGFGVLAYGSMPTPTFLKSSMNWLILAYFLHTVGELCLSPVGLAAVTRLSPPSHVGLLMGMWFLAAAFSNYLAAMIAKLTSVKPSMLLISDHYSIVFLQVFWGGLVVSLLALLSIPLIKKLMK